MAAYRQWPENELARYLSRQDWKNDGPLPLRALDLGCGNGRNGWLLHEAGFQIFGLDVDEEALTALRELEAHRAFQYHSLEHTTLLTLPGYYSDLFDLVIDCQCMQHLSWQDHGPMYQQIARALKVGGRFWSMHWANGQQADIFPDHPELTTYDMHDLRLMLKSVGLAVTGLDQIAKTYHGLHHSACWYLMDAEKPP